MWVILPMLGIGIFAASVAIVTSNVPSYLLYLCGIGCACWMYYLYKMHQALDRRTSGRYPIKPMRAAVLGLTGSFAAAWLASTVVWLTGVGLQKFYYVTMELSTAALPVIQSAQSLLSDHTLALQIAVYLGMIFAANYFLTRSMVGYIAGNDASSAPKRMNPAPYLPGVLLSAFFAIPGCLWLARNTSWAIMSGLEQDWQARILLGAFASLAAATTVLSWLKNRMAKAESLNTPTTAILMTVEEPLPILLSPTIIDVLTHEFSDHNVVAPSEPSAEANQADAPQSHAA